ncbi:MAG TPA: hybrid sensor histidine kinase/response regulator, partial [Bacteroidetes bacterium]|nr:hybrid sensor histidine kinase/response regulator [Bacteroidota bacterium]
MGEELAIESLKAGATDYVLKERLIRLAPVMRRALRDLEEVMHLRKTQELLQQSEARYRSLAGNFPNGAVLMYDRDLRYLLAEGIGLTEVGLSSQQMVGKTIWEVFPPETCARIEPAY